MQINGGQSKEHTTRQSLMRASDIKVPSKKPSTTVTISVRAALSFCIIDNAAQHDLPAGQDVAGGLVCATILI